MEECANGGMAWWLPIAMGIGAALVLPVLGFILFSIFRSIRDAMKAWMGNHIKWFVLEPKKKKEKGKEKEKDTNGDSWKNNLLQKVMSLLLVILIILIMYLLIFQNG